MKGGVRNKFFLSHPNTYATIHALSESRSFKQNFKVYQSIYKKLTPEFKNHKYAKIYKERSDAFEKLHKGAPLMVDISAEDGKGQPFDLPYQGMLSSATKVNYWKKMHLGPINQINSWL